jgi:UDP-glucose 4-epimerase
VIFGDGDQTRDFTYVTDTVFGICAAAESDALIGLPVNVARGREVSVNDLAHIILRSLDRGHLRPKYAPPRPGDVRRHWANVSFAKTHLDFSPEVDFETGIARYIDWIRSGVVDLDRAMAEEVERNWREDGR